MGTLGICRTCVIDRLADSAPRIDEAHAVSRSQHGLPTRPPNSRHGANCHVCARGCRMGVGERGYCNLREGAAARSGTVRIRQLAGRPNRGLLHAYRDPLPTNCVADWVCDGHHQRGLHNLAVFYASCTFDCLFCQNWHFRDVDPEAAATVSAEELAERASRQTYCVCFFGGDPASQMPHALASARRLAGRGVRVCWETNGSQHPRLLDDAVQVSLDTGGTVKFDLKAYDEGLHLALTGADNVRTLDNFERAAARALERRDPPLVVASTLLVPGYVTPEEVGAIALFIASIDPETPYALLAFAPQFAASDLPCTSARHASDALEAAFDAGLSRVHIGNRHLLSLADA
jgi:pyruvate formate lyase activating enzyme